MGKWRGRSARIEILDADPRGHISVSRITASDTPGTEPQSIFFQPQKLDRMQDVWLVYHEDTYYLYWLVGTQYRQRFGVRDGPPPRLYGIALCTPRDGIRWNEAGIVIKLAPDAQWMGSGAVWKRSDFDDSGVFVMNFSEWRGPTGDLGQQTIFFAESTDLMRWTRLSDDLEFVPDERWYFRNKGNGSRWDCIFPRAARFGRLLRVLHRYAKAARYQRPGAGRERRRRALAGLAPVAAPLPGEVGGCARIGDRYYMIATGLCMVADNPTGPFDTKPRMAGPFRRTHPATLPARATADSCTEPGSLASSSLRLASSSACTCRIRTRPTTRTSARRTASGCCSAPRSMPRERTVPSGSQMTISSRRLHCATSA